MAQTAQAQVPRLVELIAWLSQSDSPKPVAYRAAARRFGVPEETIRSDLDALFGLSGEHRDWLASLRVALVSGGFAVQSLGAFRRPLHFTGEEGLTLLLALAATRGGRPVALKLAQALCAAPPAQLVDAAYAIGGVPTDELEEVLAVARRARDHRRKLDILYCGSAREPSRRVVHVHQIVEAAGRWYVVAWCEKVGEFRNFRADRMLEARLLAHDFMPQVLFKPIQKPEQLLRAEETVTAKVAFSRRVARWLKERYPDGREAGDGGYVVTFKVADPAWFVREVMQYGAEAVVLEPESLREAVRRVVGG
ncbi:MAG TPA: WYL domain-containing protein [Gemmatimonadales bacterium]|nr:WYL domain-containing protein [Gemmatimonadales bacterium]